MKMRSPKNETKKVKHVNMPQREARAGCRDFKPRQE
jgi:hypothetical protein